jgi:hypothetical protein
MGVVGGADHKMVARQVVPPGFHNETSIPVRCIMRAAESGNRRAGWSLNASTILDRGGAAAWDPPTF